MTDGCMVAQNGGHTPSFPIEARLLFDGLRRLCSWIRLLTTRTKLLLSFLFCVPSHPHTSYALPSFLIFFRFSPTQIPSSKTIPNR